jgi:hypothetical protein
MMPINRQIGQFHTLSQARRAKLHNALVSGDLRFIALKRKRKKMPRISEVYSPPYWNDGASIYHLTDDEGINDAICGQRVSNPSSGE